MVHPLVTCDGPPLFESNEITHFAVQVFRWQALTIHNTITCWLR
jgi:hypothetical protein